MKQNAILLASLIVLAAALAGVGVWIYVAQIAPKPGSIIQSVLLTEKQNQIEDETASWQTYKNEEYGFEIKYPPGWNVFNNILSFKPNLVFCPDNLTEFDNSEIGCKMENGGANSLKPTYENGMIYLYSYNTNQKNNSPNYYYLGAGGISHQNYYLFSENNKEIIEQMLSTFKFIESESSYDIFGGSEFSTIVKGYYQKKEDIVYGIGDGDGENEGIAYPRAYFVITEFEDLGFKNSIEQGIKRGNFYNRLEDNHYKFNMGFLDNNQKIECYNYKDTVTPCMNEATELKIRNSTSQTPARIKLFFGKHDNAVSNLAYKIELAD